MPRSYYLGSEINVCRPFDALLTAAPSEQSASSSSGLDRLCGCPFWLFYRAWLCAAESLLCWPAGRPLLGRLGHCWTAKQVSQGRKQAFPRIAQPSLFALIIRARRFALLEAASITPSARRQTHGPVHGLRVALQLALLANCALWTDAGPVFELLLVPAAVNAARGTN